MDGHETCQEPSLELQWKSPIDADSATTVVDQLGAVLVIPIHYRTPGLALDIPLAPVEEFLADKPRVERAASPTLTITADTLPDEPSILALPYK